MTSLRPIELTCPECATSFSACIYASIDTWMDPNLIERILREELGVMCPGCGGVLHVDYELLLSCRRGTIRISTSDPVEVNRKKLLEKGVIDGDGNVVDWIRSSAMHKE
ncbi:MAG: hypothetical protein JW839_14935 [Candidatus Lokiarchaeota archaeon]|nr:hypothetical protein [Candidatus Lokiarchaeota archaeon]